MTQTEWKSFTNFRDEYKELCKKWSASYVNLSDLQREASLKDTPPYPIENSIVYNTDYDKITENDDIRLIVIGDNPGKEEQLNKNQRYLVGQSGRIAEGFFRRNPELKTDFRKNAIIVNKTPVHTAKTAHLKYLAKNNADAATLILESQNEIARLTAELHKALDAELWIVGYAELKGRGVFIPYRDTLLNCYKEDSGVMNDAWNKVFLYQHFSMNRFIVDLKNFSEAQKNKDKTLSENLKEIGTGHRKEIFGV